MFDKVVFAGGGHRCWWQAGFWEVLRAEIELRPRVIGATSMGAFMACLVHANDSRRALAWYERELAGVRTNMAWLNLFRKDAPLFRQGGIYRKSMRAVLKLTSPPFTNNLSLVLRPTIVPLRTTIACFDDNCVIVLTPCN